MYRFYRKVQFKLNYLFIYCEMRGLSMNILVSKFNELEETQLPKIPK